MSLLLKVIGGAMAGIGKGMVAQAELDAQAARDAVLHQREVALRNLQIDAQNKLADKQHGQRLVETTAQGNEQRKTNAASSLQRDWENKNQTTRQTAAQVQLKAVDFKNDVKAQKLAATLGLIQKDFESKLAAGEIVQDAEGGYHLVDKRSAAVKPVGVKGPTKAAEDDWTQFKRESTGGGSGNSGGATAPPSKPDAQFTTRYANATPETAPGLFRGDKKIPLEEAWRQYQGN